METRFFEKKKRSFRGGTSDHPPPHAPFPKTLGDKPFALAFADPQTTDLCELAVGSSPGLISLVRPDPLTVNLCMAAVESRGNLEALRFIRMECRKDPDGMLAAFLPEIHEAAARGDFRALELIPASESTADLYSAAIDAHGMEAASFLNRDCRMLPDAAERRKLLDEALGLVYPEKPAERKKALPREGM